jgi:hypothetical protein
MGSLVGKHGHVTSGMLDIEFLRDSTPGLHKHVVYVYHSSSAALRGRVRGHVKKWAESKGIIPSHDPSVALSTQIRAIPPVPLIERLICRDLKNLWGRAAERKLKIR